MNFRRRRREADRNRLRRGHGAERRGVAQFRQALAGVAGGKAEHQSGQQRVLQDFAHGNFHRTAPSALFTEATWLGPTGMTATLFFPVTMASTVRLLCVFMTRTVSPITPSESARPWVLSCIVGMAISMLTSPPLVIMRALARSRRRSVVCSSIL